MNQIALQCVGACFNLRVAALLGVRMPHSIRCPIEVADLVNRLSKYEHELQSYPTGALASRSKAAEGVNKPRPGTLVVTSVYHLETYKAVDGH